MILMDGKLTAAEIKAKVKNQVAELATNGRRPVLATVLVGEDPASQIYVAGKHRDSTEVGIASIRVDLPAEASEADVLAAVRDLNEATDVSAYIVQLPLPKHIRTDAVINAIDPAKDADGLHPLNLGRIASATSGELDVPLPCTPQGIIELGRRWGVDFDGANLVIVGQGKTVGRPLSILASRKEVYATVEICHSRTKNLAEHTRRADILVSATGRPYSITADMVAPGAAVFDVGISRILDPETGKSTIVGDVDRAVAEVAGWFSPNPGGVGPMTRAMLLENVIAAERRN